MRIEPDAYASGMVTPPDLKTPSEIRKWLADVMAERGLSTIEWATRAGVARSTLFRALAPDYAFVTSRRTLAKLAAALDEGAPPPERPDGRGLQSSPFAAPETPSVRVPPVDLALVAPRLAGISSSPTRSPPRALPLRFEIQRGVWYDCLGREVSIYHEAGVPNFEPDVRYGAARQWLELVRDDSADRQILPGSFAHVVDAQDIAYAPREGDWVVVERSRDGGRLIERTLRQVSVRPDGVRLKLCSSNPKLASAPDAFIFLDGHAHDVDPAGSREDLFPTGGGAVDGAAVATSVAGLVVGSYRMW